MFFRNVHVFITCKIHQLRAYPVVYNCFSGASLNCEKGMVRLYTCAFATCFHINKNEKIWVENQDVTSQLYQVNDTYSQGLFDSLISCLFLSSRILLQHIKWCSAIIWMFSLHYLYTLLNLNSIIQSIFVINSSISQN